MQGGKDKWELGTDFFEDVMERSTIKYNNMVKQKLWLQTDLKAAKILALTTLNNQLQQDKKDASAGKLAKNYASTASSGGSTAK